MPAGQQIAFEPALAGDARSGSPSPGRRARVIVVGHRLRTRPVRWPRRRPARRLEAVSSGPKTRKFSLSAFSLHDVAQKCAHHRVASASTPPGVATCDGIVAEIRQLEIAHQAAPPLACGLAPIRRSPCGRKRGDLGRSRPVSSNSSSGR